MNNTMPFIPPNAMLQAGAALGAPTAAFFLIQATQSQIPDVNLTWKPLFDTGVIGSVFALSCWLIKDLLRRLDAQSAIHQARLDAQTALHQADIKQQRDEYRELTIALDATMRETLTLRGEERAILQELSKGKLCVYPKEEAQAIVEQRRHPR